MDNVAYRYSDVCLLPNISRTLTRKNCSTIVQLGNREFKLPIIPANMKTVIDPDIAIELAKKGYFYIMHRFDIDIMQFVKECNYIRPSIPVSISLGVKQADRSIVDCIKRERLTVNYITIDIAHGHCSLMRDMLSYTRKALGDNVCIIAGNVCTPDGVKQLSQWGADIVKVGIGQGSPCTTKDKTGFTMPMFSCILECSKSGVPIIADGGITCTGDVAKALVAGATAVMVGGIFAKCIDSPAEVIDVNNTKQKMYYGSASFENKRHINNIEGVKRSLDIDSMTYMQKLREVKQDLQSAISYAGGNNLSILNNEEVRWSPVKN